MIEVSDALRSPYDCIITDMALRGMSGLDVIRLARGSAENAHTPIILFSASVENEADFMRAREQGVTKCFLKTRLTPTDLVQEVNTLVNAVTV
jgi:CheY-like chemotaxis protein